MFGEIRPDSIPPRRLAVKQIPPRQPPLNNEIRPFNIDGALQHPKSVEEKCLGARLSDRAVLRNG